MQRLRTLTTLVALMAGAALPAAGRADALAEIDVCISRLDADVDVGFERIGARCPELARQLQASDWAAWLPAGWNIADNNLSAQNLAALRVLVARELVLPASARRPDVARLQPILIELAAHDRQPRGWWARLQSWLRRVLARSEQETGANGFGRFLGRVSLSQTVLEFVTFGTLALVVALAAFMVVNEWRLAGRRKRPRRAASGERAPPRERTPLSWQDIESAALGERPRMLLELIAARLTAARRLPAAAALTVRELARAAQLSDAEDHERLLEVALAAERLRFSGAAATPIGLAAVLDRGRELLDRLNAAQAASV